MAAQKITDKDFVQLFEKYGPQETARRSGLHPRKVYERREYLERKYRRQITPPDKRRSTRRDISHPHRIELNIRDGIVLVGGDGHYWPGEASTAHRAFVKFCKDLRPKAVIMNGDAFDGANISRHPPIGWENNPTVEEELEAVQERLGEISSSTFKARKIWTLGNHDGRFETRLATVAPEYARIHGFHLRDHFPDWEPAWSCWINGNVVVKHRYKGGVHATHNNTLSAGMTLVTNHLHSLKVTPYTDYNGTRYGVDTGCLADPDGPQFVDYSEDNPKNHRSGFAVLTFHQGKLLPPELVHVLDREQVCFRGKVISV